MQASVPQSAVNSVAAFLSKAGTLSPNVPYIGGNSAMSAYPDAAASGSAWSTGTILVQYSPDGDGTNWVTVATLSSTTPFASMWLPRGLYRAFAGAAGATGLSLKLEQVSER